MVANGTRVEILHSESKYLRPGQFGYVVGHSDRGGMWLQDRTGESRPGESVYLVAKTKDARGGALWFSASALRRTGTKKTANKAGTKRTTKRSSNRAGSMSSRKVSAAARRHVDDLISMGRSASEVASDPRPLETWEGWAILEAAGLPESVSGEQYAAARRALAAAIRAYAGKLSRSKSNRAGTKRRNRAGSGSVTTKKLRDMGYTCQLETVKGQGYFGGDGVQAYRVRDPQGKLVNYPISTHKTARAAWEEAADRVQSGR